MSAWAPAAAATKVRHELLYSAVRVVLGFGGRVPLPCARLVGGHLGVVARALWPRDRRRAEAHLRIAFPSLGEREIRRLLVGCARHFGYMLAEVAWLWRASAHQVYRLCSLQGEHHLWAALEAHSGAILVTGHCGNWELLNARLCLAGLPITVAVRGIFDPRLDRLITTLRSRFGAEVVARGADAGRQLTASLRRNRVTGLLIDQDIRDVPTVFVPFFDRLASTPSGAAALALRRRCPTIPAFIHRRPDHTHHVVVQAPLAVPGSGTLAERVTELTAASSAAIERQVRSYPDQWVWMHRRWRTRPAGETRT